MKIIKNIFSVVIIAITLFSCSDTEEIKVDPAFPIEGKWKNASGINYKIEGTNANYDGTNTLNKYSQASIDQGFFKLTDPIFKNIAANGTNKWKADFFVFAYTEDADGKVTITKTAFIVLDLTIIDAGKTLSGTAKFPDDFPVSSAGQSTSINWTKQ